jgi:hypothetical protein
MPDLELPESPEFPMTSLSSVSGGVNLNAGDAVNIGGDVVGRDKITTNGYTAEQVATLLAELGRSFNPKPFTGRCPYQGLTTFSEDDADLFFGRESLIADLVARIATVPWLVVAGPSGSGKSSLVRAGVIPALKRGALPASDRWLYATLTPGRDPIESLALAMSRLARTPGAGQYVRAHATEPGAVRDVIESLLSDRPDQRALLFIDQFEEVFTQVTREAARSAFLNLITHAASVSGGRVIVVIALRSDFVVNCAAYPQLNALLNQQFLQVGALPPDEMARAVACPALQVGLPIDPDLIAQIVNDMQDEPGALPLMQFALKDLFDAQHAAGGVTALTRHDYLMRGGAQNALRLHADATFAALSETEQQLARSIFSNLVALEAGRVATRRLVSLEELTPAHTTMPAVSVLVRKLADARLITTDRHDEQLNVTLAHEQLITAWPWLQRLISDNLTAITQHLRIAEAARYWSEHQRDANELYRGRRLAEAEAWSRQHPDWLTATEHSFLEASRVRQRRIRVAQVAGFGAAAVLALIFLGLAAFESGPFAPRWVWHTVEDPALRQTNVVELAWADDSLGYVGLKRPLTNTIIARTQDGGQHWTLLDVRGKEVLAFAIDPDRTVYASVAGVGLLRSDDQGDHWQLIGRSLPFTKIEALAAASDRTLYVADSEQAGGLWLSRDRGETWSKQTNVPDITLFSLKALDHRLLAGADRGLWIIDRDSGTSRLVTSPGLVSDIGEVEGTIYFSSLVCGLCEVPPEPAVAARQIDDTPLRALAARSTLSPQLVTVAIGQVLEWHPGDTQLQEIANGSQLARTQLFNSVVLHNQVWVGSNTGLHFGQLRHWYEIELP